jgi:hypothetical protein
MLPLYYLLKYKILNFIIFTENIKNKNMAEELKQKFSEIQQKKMGKKEEIQIDEFEWIKVMVEILTAGSDKMFAAQPGAGSQQRIWQKTPGVC